MDTLVGTLGQKLSESLSDKEHDDDAVVEEGENKDFQ